MKKGRWKKKSNIVVTMLALCIAAINTLSNNDFYGRWYFNLLVILYSLGMILLILYPIISITEHKHDYDNVSHLAFSFVFLFIALPLLIFQSINYYKDFFNGITEFETEIYKIPVKSFYEKYPDQDKRIDLSYKGYYMLSVDDETYFDLINNNPIDETRTVYDSLFGEDVHPHLHHIKIRFYEHTKIVDTVQILYD